MPPKNSSFRPQYLGKCVSCLPKSSRPDAGRRSLLPAGVFRVSCGLLALLFSTQSSNAQAVASEWNTGSGDWNIAANWFPNQVPDNGVNTYDVQIGNRPVAASAAVNLVPQDGTSDTVSSLIVSGAADLLTNGNSLIVLGQTTLTGIGSSVFVEPATGGGFAFNTDNLDVNAGSALQMAGGTADIDVLLEVNATSNLVGHGLVVVGDADGVVEIGLENSGSIIVANSSNAVLTLRTNGVDTLDLDGTTENGIVTVSNVHVNNAFDTQTLVIDGPLSDAFGGTLSVGQRDRVTFNDSFTMDGAEVNFSGGIDVATMDGAGSVTNIANSTFAVTGGAVIGNNLTFSGAANSVSINATSTLTLGGTVSMPPLALNFVASTAALGITGAFSSIGAAEDFNWDGPGSAITTISGNGSMSLTVDQVDTGNDTYGGTLNLNDDGDVTINVTATSWTMAGTLNKNNAGTSVVSGDRMIVIGTMNVSAGTLDLPAVTTTPTASISTVGTLAFGDASIFAGAASIGGSGLLRMDGSSTVTTNTTINSATFDWDGAGIGSLHAISDGVTFTINSTTLDTDGDMDDPVNLGGNGAGLLVNGPAQWTQNGVFNANTAAAGLATIGGTSMAIFTNTVNVNGNTAISAPVTLSGVALLVDIDAGMTLDLSSGATYNQGLIDGGGTFDPGSVNSVEGDFTINADIFDFDAGVWTIESGVELTINTLDYDTVAPNAFNAFITLNGGRVDFNSADPEFVMDGVLNMDSSGDITLWTGEPISIGNDVGVRDADLNVTGADNTPSQMGSIVRYSSDADVNVAAGGELDHLNTVDFNTVNGPNTAEFTGAGTIRFHAVVNVNEMATINMAGGVVDMDGLDSVGDFINIDAPFSVQAQTFGSFGRVNGGGGINTLDINNRGGTGVLAVNLDDPATEWTLNGPGVMNLVNDNAEATLLSGNAVNLNGTVNVTGDVRTTARVYVAGVVNINTVGQPLRLAGGNLANFNTIGGGTIAGAGLLGADTGRSLRGFGSINTGVDFDGTAALLAADGTLTVNGTISDVGTLGTVGGTLSVTNAWNTNIASTVRLDGGEVAGGVITVAGGTAIQGQGLVSARVVNGGALSANAVGDLIVQTSGNDNDWDGAGNNGQLVAVGGTLELRDNATFGFTGSANASAGGRVFTDGFALDFNLGSSLQLNEGTYQSTASTFFGGTVTVDGASASTIQVQANSFLVFESTSVVTLNHDLLVANNNVIIDAGATFAGNGAFRVLDGSNLVMDAGADANVLLDMAGGFRPANSEGIGRVDVKDYQQASTGDLFIEIAGTSLNQFDRVVVNGNAVIDGYINLDIDGGFVPVIGQTFNIISTSSGVSGTFDAIDSSGLPPGLTFKLNYLPLAVQVEVIAGGDFEQWMSLFPSLTDPADRLRTADPDGDGQDNLTEFAFDGDPTSGVASGKIVGKIAPVAGLDVFTLTFPMRGGPFFPPNPPGGPLLLQGISDLFYSIEASDDLQTYPLDVTRITGVDAFAIQSGLPPLNIGWNYVTCRSPGPVAGDDEEFMRVGVSEGAP